MRVVVDLDLCGGFGVCQAEAPEVFRVVEDGGYAHVEVIVPEPDDALHEKARSAARHCPNRVITIVED